MSLRKMVICVALVVISNQNIQLISYEDVMF